MLQLPWNKEDIKAYLVLENKDTFSLFFFVNVPESVSSLDSTAMGELMTVLIISIIMIT